jgi:hypothetical protein
MHRILKQYKQAFTLHHFIKYWDRDLPTSVARQSSAKEECVRGKERDLEAQSTNQ